MANDDAGTLVSALKQFFADLGDLVRNELRLAKAELSLAIAGGIKAGIFMAVAAILAFVAALFLLQAIVIGLASLGLGMGWSSLVVAMALAAASAGAFFYGRSFAMPLTPTRTIQQINRDVAALREQLT